MAREINRREAVVASVFVLRRLSLAAPALVVGMSWSRVPHLRRLICDAVVFHRGEGTQYNLPRVLEYSRVIESEKYSSNVLVLE